MSNRTSIIVLLFTFLTTLFSCVQEQKQYSAFISGKAKNLSKGKVMVEYEMYDPETGTKKRKPFNSANIDQNGNFSLELSLPTRSIFTGKIYVGREFGWFAIEDGDSLQITLDAHTWDESLAYTGKGSAKNNYYAQRLLSIWEKKIDFRRITTLDPKEAITKAIDVYHRKITLLDSINNGSTMSPNFYRFEYDHITSEFANHVLSLERSGMKVWNDEFLYGLDLNDFEQFKISGEYRSFIQNYIDYKADFSNNPTKQYEFTTQNLTEPLRYYYLKDIVSNGLTSEHGEKLLTQLKSTYSENTTIEQIESDFKSYKKLTADLSNKPLKIVKFEDVTQSGIATLKGLVRNKKEDMSQITIKNMSSLGITPTEYKGELKDDGSFSIDVDLYYTSEVFIEYYKQQVKLVLSPGQKLFVTFDADNAKKVDFKGDGATENKTIQKFHYDPRMQNIVKLSDKASLLPGAQIKSLMKSKLNQVKETLQRDYALLPQYIQQILYINQLAFGYFEMIGCVPRRARQKAKNVSSAPLGKDYYNMQDVMNAPSVDMIGSSMFAPYLDLKTHKVEHRGLRKRENYNSEEELLAVKSDLNNDIMFELCLANRINKCIRDNDFEKGDMVMNMLTKNSQTPWVLNGLEKHYRDKKIAFNKLELPSESILLVQEDTSADTFLASLLEKHKGKAIYIDFWATWCRPCLVEMEYSNDFYNQINHENVSLVYVAQRSKVGAWKTKIAENKVRGEHHLITDEQARGLSKKLGISGIPRYMIFDKDGNVAVSNAPRPSLNGKLNINLIDQLNAM